MKNLVYFHGIHGNTTQSIAPWLEKQMKNYNILTYYPICFNDGDAFFENFEQVANKLIEDKILTEDSIIVAHSISNPFVVRFLEKYNFKPFAYISLAGFCDYFDTLSIKTQIKKSLPNKKQIEYISKLNTIKISLYSNDHIVPQEILRNFSKKINSKLYYLESKGHFGSKSGIQELPELIDIMKQNKIIN